MEKTILQYQKAFNSIIERLKGNKSILAVMVFGSMVAGDLWDESDIDLFVITDKAFPEIKNIYTEEKGIPVHIKLMSHSKFTKLYDKDLRGGFIHRIFASSRLVFSKQMDITAKYDNGRYYPDLDKERWSIVYLGNVLKSIGIAKKYLANDAIYTAYTAAVRTVDDFARLYINYSGYMISKDAITMALNLNDELKVCVDELYFNNVKCEDAIYGLINYIQEFIDRNIRGISEILLNFMKQKDCFLSADDFDTDELFVSYDISFEEILSKLWEKSIIKKETRDFKNEDGKVLFKENVYFI
jgi:uncharacterized protein